MSDGDDGNDEMSIEKAILQKSVEALIDKADDCLDAAKTQHANADAQHVLADKQHAMADKQHAMAENQIVSAEKLEQVGNALTDVALEIKGEMEWNAARTSPPPRLRDDAIVPPTRPSSTRST